MPAFTQDAVGEYARFAAAELPTTNQEIWRYSRIDELDLAAYHPVDYTPSIVGRVRDNWR
jgi:hypothetical protein